MTATIQQLREYIALLNQSLEAEREPPQGHHDFGDFQTRLAEGYGLLDLSVPVIAKQLDVTEREVSCWLKGTDFPEDKLYVPIYEWLLLLAKCAYAELAMAAETYPCERVTVERVQYHTVFYKDGKKHSSTAGSRRDVEERMAKDITGKLPGYTYEITEELWTEEVCVNCGENIY